MIRTHAALIAFGVALGLALLPASAIGPRAQTLPYTNYYEILPATSGISGVQAISDASGTVLAADVVVGQTLADNLVNEYPGVADQLGPTSRTSRFITSGQNSQGIIAINQESGNLNNQSNVFVISALAGVGNAELSDTNLVAAARTEGNTVRSAGGDREDRIQVSFFRSSGVVGVNQTAGNLNQQSNIMVLTEATEPVAGLFNTLSSSALEQVVAANAGSIEPNTEEGLRSDFMHGSFVEFRGLAQINQSAGDLNVVQNGMLVSLTGFQF